MLFKKRLTEENLVGIWKHSLLPSWGVITITNKDGHKENKTFNNYHVEIFNFKSNGAFTFGEYTNNGPFFEDKGLWRLSEDKARIELSYDNGETISIDIRNFDGRSFITTSALGNDFMFTKE